jgi:xylulokinase
VFDTAGRLLALAAAPYPVERPQPGWVEQDPDQYWDAAARCLREVLAAPSVDPRRVAALSACGQTPTMLLLDEGGVPLRPAIVWQDTRARHEAEDLARDPGTDALAEMMDLRWPVDASQPAARFRWLARHEPDVLRRAAVTLQPKDFVHFRLTGTLATDPWSAKGLVHLSTHRPCAFLEGLCGVSAGIVPRVLTSSSVVGRVTDRAAGHTGLLEGLPVVAGWTDAMTAMLGTGAFGQAGLACDVSGTSEVIGLSLPARPAETGPLMAAPIVDTGRWVLYGPTQSSGGSLGWVLRTLGLEGQGQDAVAAAAALPPSGGGLLFLPYLEGERAPIWDPAARGAFVGLTGAHGPLHLVRAVLEGVACSMWHVLSTAEQASGARAAELLVAGGGARLSAWNQIKADVAGKPLRPCAVTENGVLGAAILAAVGAGLYPSVTAAGDAMVQLDTPVLPDSARHATYRDTFARYVALYPRLKGL